MMSGVRSSTANAASLATRSMPLILMKSVRQVCSSDVMLGIGDVGSVSLACTGVVGDLGTLLDFGTRLLIRGIMAAMRRAVVSDDTDGEWAG